jgi:ribonuclease HI
MDDARPNQGAEEAEEAEGAEFAEIAELVLRTDGASRGNPGHAAAGIVIESAAGEVIAQGRRYLGVMTNNQAEYRALILGLKAVAHYHPTRVTVYMDSELVVNQMTGRYKVNDGPLKDLWREARTLASALPAITFTHVLRAKNAAADRLANEALDAHARVGR